MTTTAPRTASNILAELLAKFRPEDRTAIPGGYAAKVEFVNADCSTHHFHNPTWIRVFEEKNAAQNIARIDFTEDGERLHDQYNCDLIITVEIVETVQPGIVTIATILWKTKGTRTLPVSIKSHTYLVGAIHLLLSEFVE